MYGVNSRSNICISENLQHSILSRNTRTTVIPARTVRRGYRAQKILICTDGYPNGNHSSSEPSNYFKVRNCVQCYLIHERGQLLYPGTKKLCIISRKLEFGLTGYWPQISENSCVCVCVPLWRVPGPFKRSLARSFFSMGSRKFYNYHGIGNIRDAWFGFNHFVKNLEYSIAI